MASPAPSPPAAAPGPGFPAIKVLVLFLISGATGFLAAWKAHLGMVPGAVTGLAIFITGVFAVIRLAGVPREVWFTFCLKFFSVTAYKVLNVVLVSWLALDLGFTSEKALWLIGIWGIFMSVATLLSGSVTDAIGLRRTLLTGVTLCLLTRLVMAFSTNPWVVLIAGLFPLAAGEALCTPVLVAALRRFTSASQRSVAFSLFYAIMNVGFMMAYFIRDAVMESHPAGSGPVLTAAGMDLSAARLLLLVSFAVELLIVPLIFLLRDGAAVDETGLPLNPGAPQYPGASPLRAFRLTVRDAAADTGRLFAGLVRHPGFYRLLVFLFMIGLLKVVFNLMDYVLPTFTRLEMGAEGESRVGRFNAINSILILMLAPLAGTLTRRFSAYSMVILGGFITAFSFVFMALPPSVFQSMASGPAGEWIGRGYMELKGAVHPYFIMIVLWQVVFSIGEALYSPRVYEYAASIAPPGQEASYASLSYIPLLIGKLITGAAFGGLLTRYCPESGPRDPGTMWLIIGALVLIAPVGLLVLRRFIRVREEGREDR